MAIDPAKRDGADRLSKALDRFRREDPTFRVSTDEETGETMIAGMGELHLEIYVERIRREYNVEVEVGAPKVNYREAPDRQGQLQLPSTRSRPAAPASTPTSSAAWSRCRKTAEETFEFEDDVVAAAFPKEFIPSVEKGFRAVRRQGTDRRLSGRRREGRPWKTARITTSIAPTWRSRPARRNCFRETFLQTRPVLLEPIMKIEIECPPTSQGSVVGDLTSRRGMIVSTEVQGRHCRDRRRSAAGRDLRLLDRPAEHDAGPGHLHDGVLQVPPRADLDPARDHRGKEETRTGRREVILCVANCKHTEPRPLTTCTALFAPPQWPRTMKRV